MKPLLVPTLLVATFAAPAVGADLLSSASGNWAGSSNAGFYYRAELYENGDFVGLRICQAMEAAPETCSVDAAELNNPTIQTRQTIGVNLENSLIANEDGTLTLRARADDESYTFTENVVIQMMDNQFTVMGYFINASELQQVEGQEVDVFECAVDVWNDQAEWTTGSSTWEGAAFEDKNAALWYGGRAIELGMCPGFG